MLSAAAIWAILGLVLLIAEIFSGSFFLCFFGLAALIVASIKQATGLDQMALEIIAFATIGMSGLLFFRKKLLRNFGHSTPNITIDTQSIVSLSNDLPAHGSGKIEYQGTLWDAFNDSDQDLHRGDRASVIATRGIQLIIRPSGALK